MRDCTAKLGRQGEFTLPHRLRRKYGLAEGDVLSLLDLGGVILLSPKSSTVAAAPPRWNVCGAKPVSR